MISLAPLHRDQEERAAPRQEPAPRYEPALPENAITQWVAQQPAMAVAVAAIIGLAAGFIVKRVFRGS